MTQTNRRSGSRKAMPCGASRSTASGSQDSKSPNPASSCLGTEVSALNRAPHLPRRRLPLAAPSCYRTAERATHLARGSCPPAARLETGTAAVTSHKRATIQDAMLPANGTEAKRESPPPRITGHHQGDARGSVMLLGRHKIATRARSPPARGTMMTAWVDSPTADESAPSHWPQPIAGSGGEALCPHVQI